SRAAPVDRGALRGRPAGLLFLAPVPALDSARDARRGEPPARHHEVQAEPPPVLRRLRDLRLCTGNGSQSGLRRPARFATRLRHQALPSLWAGVAVSIAPGPALRLLEGLGGLQVHLGEQRAGSLLIEGAV